MTVFDFLQPYEIILRPDVKIYSTAMNEQRFLDSKYESWMRLKTMTTENRRSFRSQTPQRIAEFLRLYRQASADLAFAMTHSSNPDVVRFLNEVVSDAHAQIYVLRRKDFVTTFIEYSKVMARGVRASRKYIYTTLYIGLGAAIFGALLITIWPEAARMLLGPGFFANAQHWAEGSHSANTGDEGIMATAFYATNNPIVSLTAGAISVATFGVYGIYALVMNCIMLGAISQYVLDFGQLGFLYISILPHGVSELTGMFLSCSVGLQIGHKFFRPGKLNRITAVAEAAQNALPVLVLAILMMFIAAPIEGFLSFNAAVPNFVRVIVIVLSVIAWTFFFGFYGKETKLSGEKVASADKSPKAEHGSSGARA